MFLSGDRKRGVRRLVDNSKLELETDLIAEQIRRAAQ